MTKKEQMRELREAGMTYKAIGARLGVSGQYVAHVLGQNGTHGGFKPYSEQQCVYAGLRRWLNQHQIARRALCAILDKRAVHGGSATSVRAHLRGEGSFSMADINKLIEVSGMTYEELFRQGGGGNGR